MIEPNSRLKAARIRSGKTPAEIAALSGVELASYYDLENHPDELTSTISLRDLANLCRVLGIDTSSLVSNESINKISLSDVSTGIKNYLQAHSLSSSAFADQVGYDIAPALKTPGAILGWNLDGLRAVCTKIGINWLAAIP
jgi:transcriptional regulator with XRE-family HTH domain